MRGQRETVQWKVHVVQCRWETAHTRMHKRRTEKIKRMDRRGTRKTQQDRERNDTTRTNREKETKPKRKT